MANNLFQQLNGQNNFVAPMNNVPANSIQMPGMSMGNMPAPGMPMNTMSMLQNPQTQAAIQSVKRMMNMLKGKPNAMDILTMAAQQNPQLASVMNMIQQGGGSPKQVFMNYAQQMGVNPNDIINMLR